MVSFPVFLIEIMSRKHWGGVTLKKKWKLSVVDGADPVKSEIGMEFSVLGWTARTLCHILDTVLQKKRQTGD